MVAVIPATGVKWSMSTRLQCKSLFRLSLLADHTLRQWLSVSRDYMFARQGCAKLIDRIVGNNMFGFPEYFKVDTSKSKHSTDTMAGSGTHSLRKMFKPIADPQTHSNTIWTTCACIGFSKWPSSAPSPVKYNRKKGAGQEQGSEENPRQWTVMNTPSSLKLVEALWSSHLFSTRNHPHLEALICGTIVT